MQISSKIKERILPKLFYESSITLTSKPEMKIIDQYSGKCRKRILNKILINQN